jgi:hypothetical protein
MGSTFYLFYMVLFTGGVLWCLFLWLVKDDAEEEGEAGRPEDPATEVPSPGVSSRSALDSRPLPPGEAK